MSAGLYEINVEQGATWTRKIVPETSAGTLDLSGASARMQARESKSASGTILSLTSPTDITLSSGTITPTISPTVAGSLTPGAYVYDLELELSGGRFRYGRGIRFSPQ